MKLYEYTDGLQVPEGKSVVALGFFDGVHLGHRELLMTARRVAKEKGLSFGIFTFNTDSGIKADKGRIYGGETRLSLLEAMGADYTVTSSFPDVSYMECGEFVDRVLIGTMHAEVAVAGFNYRFGKGASGDAAKLQELMKERKKDTRILDEYTVDGETVSTTLIRRRLADGNMREVGTLLGAPYRIRGEVRHGRGVGKSLGFPTVNTTLNGGLAIPKYGVYRSATVIDGRIYSCITNVGICPTFGLSDAHAETYIIGYTGDLYGDSLDIYLLDYLRDEIKFSSPEALIMQINVDKERVINEFGEIAWQELGLK